MTVTGVDVYWCCTVATLNLHMYCTAMGDNCDVMAAQKLNDSTAHIRTWISGFRLIMFLFTGCLVRNQPESVLKLFLNLFQKW